ncbi:MAG: CoA pyrophosphatase [Deltaproteobacteria bacterium]|nr:CoA pyrophosphatase [Deltaproteobacteria bacterium]
MPDSTLLRTYFPRLATPQIPLLKGKLLPLSDHWQASEQRQAATAFLWIPPASPGGMLRLVLTRRSMTLPTHKGQISFAGGHRDAGDRNPAETALRETEEETGLRRNLITPLAQLPALPSVTGVLVTAVIMAAAAREEDFCLNQAEADLLILSPWDAFLMEKRQSFSLTFRGRERSSFAYLLKDLTVWGLTARMISQAIISRPL